MALRPHSVKGPVGEQVMMTTKHQFEYELRRMIHERIEAICEHLGNGSAKTYEEYQHKVGVVAGLRSVFDDIDEANAILSGKLREKGSMNALHGDGTRS